MAKRHWISLLVASVTGAIGLGGLGCVLCSTLGIALVALFGLNAVLFVTTNNQAFLAVSALFFLMAIAFHLENKCVCSETP